MIESQLSDEFKLPSEPKKKWLKIPDPFLIWLIMIAIFAFYLYFFKPEFFDWGS